MAAIVLVTVLIYVPLTIVVTEWRGKVRKAMNSLDNARDARATDMLLNYETIKYFTGEDWELRKYANAVSASKVHGSRVPIAAFCIIGGEP